MSRKQHKEQLDRIYDALSQALDEIEAYLDQLRSELAEAEPHSEEAERLQRLVELTTQLAQMVDDDALTMTIKVKDLMFALDEMRSGRFW